MAGGKGEKKAPKRPRKEYDLNSRCYPGKFNAVMTELREKMSEAQHDALKRTPFYSYMDMPKLSYSMARVVALLNRFQSDTKTFLFGEDIHVPFPSSEFSIVMGLHDLGCEVYMNINLKKLKSETLTDYFDGCLVDVTRNNIEVKLMALLKDEKKDEPSNIQFFVRMYVLFIFNCILFPTSNLTTPGFLLPYVDDLSSLGEYAWGRATHAYLMQQITDYTENGGRIKYISGCMIDLIVSMVFVIKLL